MRTYTPFIDLHQYHSMHSCLCIMRPWFSLYDPFMTPVNEYIQESDWGAYMVKCAQFYNYNLSKFKIKQTQPVGCVENIVMYVPLFLLQW